ncbi:cilia- and flagella-associated protein 299 isoform X2 [Desmodus rotundus]|uniref:cilia- and flagella-associated protein 299 isoform X2 n=1 Tax=Desmodus rotundus TaxID=9430 RepID=UPI001E1C02F5|nr:cilia- and flagella-associated protein 299 isoform X2 [Desmodus rotundus]
MDLEDGLTALDKIVTQFNTYEDYLDSQITDEDLYYLEDEDLAHQLVELGCRGTGKVVKRGDFEARKAAIVAIRKAAIEAAKLAERTQKKTLTSTSKDLQDNFLKALAVREEDNRNGKMSSVIFIRDRNSHGQQVSAYIDYAHRLKTEDFEAYFNGKKRLLPRPTDLRLHQVKILLEPPSTQNYTSKLSFLTTLSEDRLNYQHVTWLPNCTLNLNETCNQKQVRIINKSYSWKAN